MALSKVDRIEIGDLTVEVERKQIANMHLRVYPPDGKVKITVPLRVNIDLVRGFVNSKRDWIAKHQQKMRDRVPAPEPLYIAGETHYLWGKAYRLEPIETNSRSQLIRQDDRLLLYVRFGTADATRTNADIDRNRSMLEDFYRRELEIAIPPLITQWERSIGVKVASFKVRKMKSRWGSCSPVLGTIRLSLELAQKPRECLEYVVVHELVHLLEPSHNKRFVALMDRFLPDWKLRQSVLDCRSMLL